MKAKRGGQDKAKEHKFLEHWNVQPWPEQVDGDALLQDLAKHLIRYLVLPAKGDTAVALWILHTWVFDCFDITQRPRRAMRGN